MTGHNHQHQSERIGPLIAFVQNADERLGFVQAGGHRRVPSGRQAGLVTLGYACGRGVRSAGAETGTLAPSPLTAIDGGLSQFFPYFSLVQAGRHAVIFLQQRSDEDGV